MPAISAMDGYHAAENAARAINTDLSFIGVLGYTRKTSIDQTVAVDGKATSWSYLFGSVSARKEMKVRVNGESSVANISSYDINTTKMPDEVASFQDIHPVADWKLDSTAAAQIALPVFMEKYGPDAESAMYILLNYRNKDTGDLTFYWWVTIYGKPVASDWNGTSTFVTPSSSIFIDPITGAILPAPVSESALPAL
jgi:hypothetical protein